MFTTHAFGHLALDSTQLATDGFTSSDINYQSMIGHKGIAHTVLRPAGKIKIGKEIYDATAEAGYIEKGNKIIVTSYQTSQLLVQKIG